MTNRERRRLAKTEKKQLCRLARLGISNFESLDKTQKRQIDLINRLKGTHIDTAGLHDCGPFNCGRAKCAEGCPFGARRRRFKEIVATHRLMAKVAGPIYEIRVARGCWARPIGKLREVSIGAATKLIRRVLDTLFNPDIVAVGTFKLSQPIDPSGVRWQPEIHVVVAGAKKAELEQALHAGRRHSENLFQVNTVKNFGQLISNVLRRDVWASQQTWLYQSSPTKRQRREFYEWSMSCGERIIRYGCDRYFNPLPKKPRMVRPKLPKKHPYPRWLEPHMFGRGKWENINPQEMTYQPKNKHVRVVDPGDDYYGLDRSDEEK